MSENEKDKLADILPALHCTLSFTVLYSHVAFRRYSAGHRSQKHPVLCAPCHVHHARVCEMEVGAFV